MLDHGGSYVTFVNKDKPSDFTIVIETMVYFYHMTTRSDSDIIGYVDS